MTTPHKADLINADRRAQADMMRERLERVGVSCTVAHFTGPTEYTVAYGNIQAVGPTFDLALFEFVEKLLAEKKRREGPALPTQEPHAPAH